MKGKKSYITATDQFCGAGGSTSGAKAAGVEVKMALNHWKLAIETHNTNHPTTDHDCTDIQACDPRRYPSTDLLITSPECTNHTNTKGVSRKMQQRANLFGSTVDAAAERSRATMWDVCRFAEFHKYNLIIVENVVEARAWITWDAWLQAMHALGYNHKCVYMNSMHHWPTPQSRDRMYVVFWRKGNPAPDLDFRPAAYCEHCEKTTNARQSWKNPAKPWGKYGKSGQYIYRCGECLEQVQPHYYAAFNCIDWTIPSMRIGDRKKPLAANTMERIQAGIDKYGQNIYTVTTRYSSGVDCRLRHISEPLPTQPGDYCHGVVMPLMVQLSHSSAQIPATETMYPLFTQTTAQSVGIAIPMVVANYSPGWTRSTDQPLGTITTTDHHGLLTPPLIVENFTGGPDARTAFERLGCVTAGGVNYGILTDKAMQAFIASYYSSNHQTRHMTEAVGAITTKDRMALVQPGGADINDYHYRMLVPKEIQAAMAFPDDYIVLGNGSEKVKQLGNAVTPPAMEWLVKQCVKSLN